MKINSTSLQVLIFSGLSILLESCHDKPAKQPDFSEVPGTIIQHMPASTRT
jgi:hypothetical protein